ncbi:MAG: response regulator [Desulfarculaceae bacterium]
MSASRIKVLLVDDEPQFRASTKKILDRRGFLTLAAGSGDEALAMLAENPEVVVLDIKMPGKDGLDVLHEIKERAAHLPVIMLTGHGSEEAAQVALEKGAYDFLNKPCDIDLLASRIKKAHGFERAGQIEPENKVREVMIPREDYTEVSSDTLVKDAIVALRDSFSTKAASNSIMETGHRSMLVTDSAGKVVGILTILDLLRALMPSYFTAPKPFLADSIQYSPMFWEGMFTREVKALGKRSIGEFMSPTPPVIDADANLMLAAYTMIQKLTRRLLVTAEEEVVGVIREQDLFFEMERILRG